MLLKWGVLLRKRKTLKSKLSDSGNKMEMSFLSFIINWMNNVFLVNNLIEHLCHILQTNGWKFLNMLRNHSFFLLLTLKNKVLLYLI